MSLLTTKTLISMMLVAIAISWGIHAVIGYSVLSVSMVVLSGISFYLVVFAHTAVAVTLKDRKRVGKQG